MSSHLSSPPLTSFPFVHTLAFAVFSLLTLCTAVGIGFRLGSLGAGRFTLAVTNSFTRLNSTEDYPVPHPPCTQTQSEDETVAESALSSLCAHTGSLCSNYSIDLATLDRALLFAGDPEILAHRVLEPLLMNTNENGAFRIGVIGGSISLNSEPNKYFGVLYDYLVELSRSSSSSPLQSVSVELVNGAIGATNSLYFQYCALAELNWPTNATSGQCELNYFNLILIELSVNDGSEADLYLPSQENLIRRLLHCNAAVLLVSMFSPSSPRYVSGEETWLMLAQYYSIPLISVKHMMFGKLFQNAPQFVSDFYKADHHHPNIRLHRLVGETIIYFFKRQLAAFRKLSALHPDRSNYRVPVPIPRISDWRGYDSYTKQIVSVDYQYYCRSVQRVVPDLFPRRAVEWRKITVPENKKVYWSSKNPTVFTNNSIEFDFTITESGCSGSGADHTQNDCGQLHLLILTSAKFHLGTLECVIQFHNNPNTLSEPVRVNAYKNNPYNLNTVVALSSSSSSPPPHSGLTVGSHGLVCRLLPICSDQDIATCQSPSTNQTTRHTLNELINFRLVGIISS